MARSLRFFYLGYQCPHNTYLLARVKTVAWKESVTLHLHDITRDAEVCERYRIFSPTVLIVNDDYRWNGPFSTEDVVAMLEDDFVEYRKRGATHLPRGTAEGETVPLDHLTALSTSRPCLDSDDVGLCRGKAEWTNETMGRAGVAHLGRLLMVDGACVGGVEYLPSELVPYPIPDKRKGNAFLTCSYMPAECVDARTHPLNALIEDLRGLGYDRLSVAAATEGCFPNGPVEWFERRGFVDRGLLSEEEFPEVDIRYLQLDLG